MRARCLFAGMVTRRGLDGATGDWCEVGGAVVCTWMHAIGAPLVVGYLDVFEDDVYLTAASCTEDAGHMTCRTASLFMDAPRTSRL